MRSSPLVRITRSGSGISGRYNREAIAAFESPTQYFETQQKLAGEYTERAQARAHAYFEVLQDAGKALTGWTEEATAAATEVVTPAKPKAARRKKAA